MKTEIKELREIGITAANYEYKKFFIGFVVCFDYNEKRNEGSLEMILKENGEWASYQDKNAIFHNLSSAEKFRGKMQCKYIDNTLYIREYFLFEYKKLTPKI